MIKKTLTFKAFIGKTYTIWKIIYLFIKLFLIFINYNFLNFISDFISNFISIFIHNFIHNFIYIYFKTFAVDCEQICPFYFFDLLILTNPVPFISGIDISSSDLTNVALRQATENYPRCIFVRFEEVEMRNKVKKS